MGKHRLRPSIFPGCPPYLTFLSPQEEYEDGQEPIEELVMSLKAPPGTSLPIIECFQRFGFSIDEVLGHIFFLSSGNNCSGQPVTCVT